MKSIVVATIAICLWGIAFWAIYSTLDFEEISWFVELMVFATIYSGIFTVGIANRKSALDAAVKYFSNIAVHGTFWLMVFVGFMYWYIGDHKSSPDFDSGNSDHQLGVALLWSMVKMGVLVNYLPIVVLGAVGWAVSKMFLARRVSYNKSFNGSALRAPR